ncbi:MAG: protein phosphatase 2C domain-containing protein [Lachnospiraceae bacterium]|nr:protein phosphatase 2C domain-containing protein [Lachnospiraceae bacterium]
MVSGIYWSVGERSVNEDSVAYEEVLTDRGNCTLMAVCDGIGSLYRGEIVSGYITQCLVRWFYSEGIHMRVYAPGRIKRSLCRSLYNCHMDLSDTARKLDIKWGSTCTCVCIWGGRYVCVHLGDSAAYIISPKRGGKKITKDHINNRGELIRCLGSMGYFMPDIITGRIYRGEGILVASDGFAGGFQMSELSESLSFGKDISEDRIVRRLAAIGNEAGRRGGSDNRSAVFMRR